MEEGNGGVEDALTLAFCLILCTTLILLPFGLALWWCINKENNKLYQIEYTHNKKRVVTPFLDNVTYNIVIKDLKKRKIIYMVTKKDLDNAEQCNCTENQQD